MIRIVAVYQTQRDKQGATLFYEIARVILDDTRVQFVTSSETLQQVWAKQGVPSRNGELVRPSAGSAFLDAVRDDYNKGGRCFALDSGRGEAIPPPLLAMDTATVETVA